MCFGKVKMYIVILTLFLGCVWLALRGIHIDQRGTSSPPVGPELRTVLGQLSVSTLGNQGMMVYRGRGFLGLIKNKTLQLYFEYLYKSSKDRGSQCKSLVCELSTPNSW